MTLLRLVCIVIGTLVLPCIAAAQTLPSTIRIIVGYPAGGTNDILARIVAAGLEKQLNLSVVVENVPGASGTLAQNRVLNSSPDGATVLLGSVNDILQDALTGTQKVQQSFSSLGGLASMPTVLVGGTKLSATNTSELVQLSRKPGSHLTIAAAGTGTSPHLAAELFRRDSGAQITYVPYAGAPRIINDLVGGHIDLATLVLPGALAQIRAGTIRAYGLVSTQRSPNAPEIPTLIESDELKSMKPFADPWNTLMVSSNVPSELKRSLAGALEKVISSDDVQEQIKKAGAVPMLIRADDMQRMMESDAAHIASFVKAANIRAQ